MICNVEKKRLTSIIGAERALLKVLPGSRVFVLPDFHEYRQMDDHNETLNVRANHFLKKKTRASRERGKDEGRVGRERRKER